MAFRNRLRLLIAVALVGGLGVLAQAADVNVVGTWKGSMDTQMGTVENTITIQTASPLAGTVALADYKGTIEKGTLQGDRIAFQITIEPGTIAYEGTVSGDEMKLTVTGTTGNKMALVARRQK
jgi:hypothetical protein